MENTQHHAHIELSAADHRFYAWCSMCDWSSIHYDFEDEAASAKQEHEAGDGEYDVLEEL